MTFEKPPIFRNIWEFLGVGGFLIVVIGVRLWLVYGEYREFVAQPFHYTQATILEQQTKTKNNRTFEVIKLRVTGGKEFYTTDDRKSNLVGYRVRVRLDLAEKMSFLSYLGTPFVKTTIKTILQITPFPRTPIVKKIETQHDDLTIASFYNGIFLATPLSYELRESIILLGMSHMVTLSGFHLGILWVVLFWVLRLLYRPLQQRYFPYRYELIDLGVIAIIFLGVYVWVVHAPPSLVRSYGMVILGWVAVVSGVGLVNFYLLGLTVLLLLALWVDFIASIGFWFSVAGVYYIFLILHYESRRSGVALFLFISFGVFFAMIPIVHGFFSVASPLQLLSIPLSILFTPFYPLSIAMHFIGYGDFIDGLLTSLFSLTGAKVDYTTPPIALALLIILNLTAIWSRAAYIATFTLPTLFGVVLYGGFYWG